MLRSVLHITFVAGAEIVPVLKMIKLSNREFHYSARAHKDLTRRGRTYTQVCLTPGYPISPLSRGHDQYLLQEFEEEGLSVRPEKSQETSCSVAQLYPTLCDPMSCSPPGSSVHGVIQANKLEWVAMLCLEECKELTRKLGQCGVSWWGQKGQKWR